MSPREAILDRLRQQTLPPVEQPSLDHPRQSFDDCLLKFEEVLQTVGGAPRRVADTAEAIEAIGELSCYQEANKVVSVVPGMAGTSLNSQLSTLDSEKVAPGTAKTHVDLAGIADPHELHDIDLAILSGKFAVAENAAIWLDLESVKHRVICVLSQHLVVVVPAAEIVATMHEAYARIARSDGAFDRPSFGVFLSGPSKTADIEQSLVIGAHGARSLTVLLTK